MVKKCIKCNVDKEIEEFNKSKCTIGGYKNICKYCRKEYNKINKEKNKKYLKEYNKLNQDKIKKQREEYNKLNQDKIKEYSKKYYNDNKDAVMQKIYTCVKNRKNADPLFKLKCNLRTRLSKHLSKKNIRKNKKTEELIGINYNKLKAHIEKQFSEGMNWSNYGEWHIDHIIPLCSASNEEEVYNLFNYKNLQPLWAMDNIKKGGKF
jgi:hypothetical protein